MVLSQTIMLNRLKNLLSGQADEALDTARPAEDRLQIATCVLLLEVACADDEFSPEERALILATVRERFSLNAAEAEDLLAAANRTREHSVDLWQFTNRINKDCSAEEKVQIINEVWRVICADHAIDGHEDHIAHRLAKLLNLRHHELIEAKVKVLEEFRG